MSKSSSHPALIVDQSAPAEPHLRSVLETQPVILVRLARDGTFLAVNESGVSALGAERLDQLLGTSIASLLPVDERNTLMVFLDRVITGHRGSIEIDLTALTGTRHTMQFHAAPHPGGPDGIDSLLATLRDVTESRRLEQSLVEAMARQAEQESAHEAERARLAAELAEARQSQIGTVAEAAEIAVLERKLAEAAEHRAELTARHAAEVEGLTEALDERTQISDEQAARLTATAASQARLSAELTDAGARHDAAVEAARTSMDQAKQELAAGFEADITALKDALNQAMEDQARLAQTLASHEEAARQSESRVGEMKRALEEASAAVRARQQVEKTYQSRTAVLEAALASARAAEQQAMARFASLGNVADRIAEDVRKLAAAVASGAGLKAGALAERIERPLVDVLGKEISLAVLVATPDMVIAAPADRIEQALVALAVNRGAAMRSGQIAIEIADVSVDEDAARGRGGMAPGDYALIAVHVAGEGAGDGLPQELFETGDAETWSRAQPELAGVHEATRAGGGVLWLANEGAGVVFELYLPRRVAQEAR